MTAGERKLAQEALAKTERLADSLRSSVDRLRAMAPLSAETVRTASSQDKDLMDAFVHRYCKLQDLLGTQIFRAILILDLEDPPAAMMDLVNAVAKRGIVDDLAEWAELRRARNRLVHEYEDAPDRAARALQDALDKAAPLMLAVHDRAAAYLTRRLAQIENLP